MSYASEVTADAPVAWYRCQEASGLLQDSGGNARHCTASGGAGSATYQRTSPITTESSDLAIQVSDKWFSSPDGAWFDTGDIFSLECWVKRSATGTHIFISKGTGSYSLYFNGSGNLALDRVGLTTIVSSTITITDTTTWHHVVATKSGATVKLYIDGVNRTGTVTNDTIANNAIGLFIGATHDGFFMYQGDIDEIAIYSTALSEARVLVHYNEALGIAATLPAIQSRVPMPMFRVPGKDKIMAMNIS